MPKYDMQVPTRTEWQNIRDKAKVPKGAAKVSIGDSIEKVHKSLTPNTISKNEADTQQLITNLDAYIAQTKTKYPAFEAEVKKVKKKAENHLAFLKSIAKAKEAFYPRYSAAVEAFKTVRDNGGKPDKLAGKIEQLRGCIDALGMIDPHWAGKQQMVRQYHTLCGSSDTLSDKDKAGLDAMFKDIKP